MLIWILLTISFFSIIGFWIYGFLVQNDLSVSTKGVKKYRKILAIFAHPDDELMTCGGTMGHHGNATLFLLTKGERGTPDAHLELGLKEIRNDEAKRVTNILGAKKLIHDDLGDGQLDKKRTVVIKRIKQVIEDESPDLVITHELSGGYGHPDHMTCASCVTEVLAKNFPKIHLWYGSSPDAVRKMMNLPVQMAKDQSYKELTATPTHKVFIGIKNFNRIRALYSYRSQYQSFVSASPLHPIPMWFLISMSLHEFFHEVS